MRTHNILTLESISIRPTTNNRNHSFDSHLISHISYHNPKSGKLICRLHILTEANFIFNPEKIFSVLVDNFIAGKSAYRFESSGPSNNYKPLSFEDISNLYEIDYIDNQLSTDFKAPLDILFEKVQTDENVIKKITNSFFQ